MAAPYTTLFWSNMSGISKPENSNFLQNPGNLNPGRMVR
jgi:hypothetical protein